MSNHLPECKALDAMPESYKMFMRTSQKWFWEHSCICDALRACEQRMIKRVEASAEIWSALRALREEQ